MRWILWLCLSGALWAHPLAEQARALAERAQSLSPRLNGGSWGQEMAVTDLQNFQKTALALATQLEVDPIDWDASWQGMQQLQSAATQWKLSSSMLSWGQEEALLAQGLTHSAQSLESDFREEKQREFERRLVQQRPQPVLRSGWGWGWGYWGARPIFIPGRWGRGCR